MLKNWDWDDTWQTVIVLAIVVAVAFGGIYAFAPKEVDYYYMSTSNSGSRSLGFCVYAHWTWHSDEIAYCSDDKDKVLDFAAKANATLKRK